MNLNLVNESLWSLLFLPLFLLCALRLAPCLRLPPLRVLRAAESFSEGETAGMKPAQAASTALAATVGTGNIVGTAQAIAMGGPGAVFWLWVAAILGCAVKYAEIYQGQRHRGGAMAYIDAALGPLPARCYAALAAVSALLVGNMAQINGTVSALCGVTGDGGALLRAALGLVITAFLGVQIVGGARRVGRFCESLVPLMSVCYVLVLGLLLFVFRARLPHIFQEIIADSFHPRAAAGAAGGAALRQTVVWGLRRGAFSNEAGLGSAANIHAEVRAGRPELHGLWGVFEVLVDTLLLCTLTALAILCSGIRIPWGSLPGPELLRTALASLYGRKAAFVFLSIELTLFGFSTVLGCYVCGQRCVRWLGGKGSGRAFFAAYLLCALLGCVLPVDWIWQAADAVNVLLAVPNLLALLLLAPSTGGALRSLGKLRHEETDRENLTSKGKVLY